MKSTPFEMVDLMLDADGEQALGLLLAASPS